MNHNMGPVATWWRHLRKRPARSLDLSVRGEAMGSSYGGYVVKTDVLDQHSVVYSFGIGEDMTWDLALIDRLGVTVHAFDPTPRAIAYAKGLAVKNVVVHEYGVFDRDGVVRFHLPKNPDHVSRSVLDPNVSDRVTAEGATELAVRRLTTIAKDLGHTAIDVMKMDVEGAEYAVIDQLEQAPVEIGQLLIEFHHMLPGIGMSRTERAIDQLVGLGFRPFAMSATGREWSFVHESRR